MNWSPNHASSTRTAACALALAGFVLASACNDHSLKAPDPFVSGTEQIFQPVNPPRNVDILFIIDDSGSMKSEQTNLRNNFKVLIDELRQIDGGLPNVHIAVATSDVGAGVGAPCKRAGELGSFQAKPGCGLDDDSKFIVSLEGETDNNFTGDLSDVFSCIADVGIGGCGFEHQLQAMRLALLPDLDFGGGLMNGNDGFIRDDAFLAVIIITDEDDCSAPPSTNFFSEGRNSEFMGQAPSLRCALAGHDCGGGDLTGGAFESTLGACKAKTEAGELINIADFTNFLVDIKGGDADKVIVSAIAGWPTNPEAVNQTEYSISKNDDDVFDINPACKFQPPGSSEDDQTLAAPALRIKSFVDSFGENGILESICTDDFSPALKRIGQLIGVRLSPACIEGQLVDVDPNEPGIQADCLVDDAVPDGSGGVNLEALTSCTETSEKPCYNLLPPTDDRNTCGNDPPRWLVTVDRVREPPTGTTVEIRCQTCAGVGGESAGCE